MKKIIDIFKANDERKLVLPDFQRDFEWKEPDQRRLLSSFLVSLPIGSLLLLKGGKNDFAAKKLCFPRKHVDPKEDCLYLLDGQQRISSLKGIFSDFFSEPNEWMNIWDDIYNNLKFRWFIKIKLPDSSEEAEDDLFGWRKLRFEQAKYEPEQIINYIECKRIYKGKTDQWYNPGFNPKDDKGKPLEVGRKILKIAKYASDEYLVPLYTLYNPNSSDSYKLLHERVIENIAENRVKELKTDVEDGNADIFELLKDDVPYIEGGDNEQIVSACNRLTRDWISNMQRYLDGLLEQEIHIITLPSDEIGRATSIFENINRGGTPLDVYDLIVAKAARDREAASLTQRIVENLETDLQNLNDLYDDNSGQVPDKWSVECMQTIVDKKPCKRIKNQYLSLLSIFCHCGYGDDRDVKKIKVEYTKNKKQLELNDEQINNNTDITITAIKRACAFLQFRCGIIYINNLPYELMILPIAYVMRDDNIWQNRSSIKKIEYWYWTSLFGGAYRERQNERCIKDIKNLYKWLKGSDNTFKSLQESILNDSGYSDLNTLLMQDEDHPVTSAIHDAVLQYILSKQPKDFLLDHKVRLNAWDIATKKDFEYEGGTEPLEVNDHHIYPISGATLIGESSKKIRKDKKNILNSPLNRTYISKRANSLIYNKSPKDYLDSDFVKWGHCIPDKMSSTEIINKLNQKDYIEVLTERYKDLKKELLRELERLENV